MSLKMYKFLVASISIILLAGCSTTHETYQQPQQYCYTDQTIRNTDGNISSETVLNCTDRPKVHHLNRDIGVAGMCRPYQREVVRPNGHTMNIRGVLCRDKLTGKWVPADPNLSY
jgi:hypothetical protein